MRTIVFLAAAAALSACAALTGPLVDQDPERQAVADKLHDIYMKNNSQYRTESGVKVMVSCIVWDGLRPAGAFGTYSYYYPARYAARTRPVRELERLALGECQSRVPADAPDCTCAPVDINGRNAIAVP